MKQKSNKEYYIKNGVECIDLMVDTFGIDKTIAFCELCIFKYNFRKGNKAGNTIDMEEKKIKWYKNKIKELEDLKNDKGIC